MEDLAAVVEAKSAVSLEGMEDLEEAEEAPVRDLIQVLEDLAAGAEEMPVELVARVVLVEVEVEAERGEEEARVLEALSLSISREV